MLKTVGLGSLVTVEQTMLRSQTLSSQSGGQHWNLATLTGSVTLLTVHS
jgi:hypothetical protein